MGLDDDLLLVNCVPGLLILIQECSRLDNFYGLIRRLVESIRVIRRKELMF